MITHKNIQIAQTKAIFIVKNKKARYFVLG